MDTPLDMQFDSPTFETERAPSTGWAGVSFELIAYGAILVLALVLRLAELDTTPIMASETHNALAAWRVIMPNAPGEPLIASSALLFALQSLSFSVLGGTELAARIATVLGGAALVLVPVLFRPLIGTTRAIVVSVLLAFSPVLLIASRTSSPDVWALLLALLGLAALARAKAGQSRPAVLAVVLFAGLLFLTGAGGVALALIIAVAGGVAGLWRRNTVVINGDDNTDSPLSAVRGSLGLALPLAALVVLAISTGLMLYPSGLSAVGESIGGAIRAVVQPHGIAGYGGLTSLFYEPILWVLAVVGLVLRRERLTAVDVFLAAWVVLGVMVSLFFGDNLPDHALWLLAPLAGLASNALLWAVSTGARLACRAGCAALGALADRHLHGRRGRHLHAAVSGDGAVADGDAGRRADAVRAAAAEYRAAAGLGHVSGDRLLPVRQPVGESHVVAGDCAGAGAVRDVHVARSRLECVGRRRG
ncbi:MAG: hypothetical protein U0703_27925 [Anaerolineae bacterium]